MLVTDPAVCSQGCWDRDPLFAVSLSEKFFLFLNQSTEESGETVIVNGSVQSSASSAHHAPPASFQLV